MEFFRTDRRQLGDTPEKRLCLGAECRCCHTVEWVPNNVPGDAPPEFAAKLFRQRGWDVGKRRKDDTCPRCKGSKVRAAAPAGWFERLQDQLNGADPVRVVAGFQVVTTAEALAIAQADPALALVGSSHTGDAKRLAPLMARLGFSGPKGISLGPGKSVQGYRRPTTHPEKRDTADMNTPAPAAPASDVRQPTREDRRKIVDFLDSNYDLDKGCYIGDLTDAAVAERLNLPRAWVSEERERMYGPEANQAGEKLVERYDELVAKAGVIEQDVVKLMERADACIREIKQLEPAVAALRRR